MINLITGVPGAGKTLKMISDLMTRNDLKNRPLYLDGIPEVDGDIIPNQPIPDGETMQTWHKWAPTGAILVIDECQRVFRPRPSGSKVPDYVAELETHRHKGIDIFLLTQHPRLIDSSVRALVGHHYHIGKTNLGLRRILEWEGCGDPTLTKDVYSAVKSVYTLDKRAFGVYKSAEEHTKIKTRLSRVVYIFPIVLAMIIFAAWTLYGGYKDVANKDQKPPISASAEIPAVGGAVAAPAANGTDAAGQYPPKAIEAVPPPVPHLSAEDYEPRIDGMPHTAPLYDGMNKAVKTMPYPVACVKNANKCTCYTEQATPIKGMDKQQCLYYVEDGIYNPYKEPTVAATAQTVALAAEMPYPPEMAQVEVMGGKSQQNLMYDNQVPRDGFGAQNGAIAGGV